MSLVSVDYGWLGIGGDFSDTPHDPAQPNRAFSVMARAVKAEQLLGQAVDIERWRAHTGLRSLYLILVQSSDHDQPEASFDSVEDGTRVYTVAYDWVSGTFLDKGVGAWRLAGYLALVLAEISKQDDIPLPLPR